MTSATKYNNTVVLRDEQGRTITKLISSDKPKETARAAVRRVTNNGVDLYLRLYDIATGKPHIYREYDANGKVLRESQPVLPSIESQRAAAKDLIEFLHGKAVPQTDVVQAEEQQVALDQLQAMSDDQLWAIASAKRKALSDADPGDGAPSEGE